jgi:predicted NUDIX family NTP pyrophosphohydrolase
MTQRSAGILLYRRHAGAAEVLLVHPGGPFFARKDDGAWSVPKGLIGRGEDPLAAARREFLEETGAHPPEACHFLGEFRQPGGKAVTVYAAEGDFDLAAFRSNSFKLEWPPRSGKVAEFPEADRAAWFGLAAADAKILKGQRPALEKLAALLASGGDGPI